MPTESKAEPDTGDDKMPHKSKEEQDEEIKQRQNARVSRLLNQRVPQLTKAVDNYIPIAQKHKDNMLRDISAAPNTELEKIRFMATSNKWQAICKLCADSHAIQLIIDEFESGFRKEWIVKKKDSLETRDAYTKDKRRAFKTMQKRYLESVRDNLKAVGKDYPGYKPEDDTSDEENWDIKEEVGTRVDDDEAPEELGTRGDEETGAEEAAETDETDA